MVYADIFVLGTYKAVVVTLAAFTDIGSHTAKDAINFVTVRGLISGTSGTAYPASVC